ncbi:Carnitine O-acetyltransferase [Holothuria leucospilota]|uniref:Carnitine O-acetyltransferase n=1 Tax=Holothuria leucospilota TaxID=206669 RepID=A0A9Q1BUX8_HOLLE|nr:Carnitine O-acetyltransferase [Holothuria leucospilota]
MVEEFCKPGGTGERLQEALQRRADLKENWLSDWWRIHYLQVRDPLVLTSSPCFLFHRQEFSGVTGQIEYAAKLIFSTAQFASLLAR